MNASETNGVQHLGIVAGFLIKLRDAATSLARGLWGFGIQEEEAAAAAVVVVEVSTDLETGPPEAEESNVLKSLQQDNFNRAGRSSTGEIAQVILSTFPSTFLFTLAGLLSLAQIKGQLAPLSPTLHKWYIVCVTSLLAEFVASIAQWIISAAAHGP